jgi:hypothetical protein
MPRIIDTLREWKGKRPKSGWVRVRDFNQEVQSAEESLLKAILRELDRCTRTPPPEHYESLPVAWKPEIASTAPNAMALCQVVSFEGDEAECKVFIDGFELPKVSFPAWILRQKGLGIGGRFIWAMRDGSRVRSADIDSDVSQIETLTATERGELDQLYQESLRRRADDGGIWPEYTGPGL